MEIESLGMSCSLRTMVLDFKLDDEMSKNELNKIVQKK